MNKNVALVWSSGGERGLAHIGAIEELTEQGYHITTIAGTSMGSLIGGMYAAGKLDYVKEWMCNLDRKKIMSLVDISLSRNHLVKGDKIVATLNAIHPDTNIEDLPISFCAVATDLKHSKEVIFTKGSLYEAIRASISIPSFFRPVKTDDYILVDGGVINPLPLNRVVRNPNDLLVAVNVSAYDDNNELMIQELSESDQTDQTNQSAKHEKSLLKHMMPKLSLTSNPEQVDHSYLSLIKESYAIMLQQNSILACQITPPDVLVGIPMSKYGGFDYDKAEQLIKEGRLRMREALKRLEK